MWGKEETVMVWDEPDDRSNRATINLEKAELVEVSEIVEVVDLIKPEVEELEIALSVNETDVAEVTEITSSSVEVYGGNLMSLRIISLMGSIVMIGLVIAIVPWALSLFQEALSNFLSGGLTP